MPKNPASRPVICYNRFMIKAIIFDLGNVVLTNDYSYNTPEELKEFCDYFGATMDNLYLGFWAAFPEFALGKCSEDEFWKTLLYTARAKNADINHAKKLYRKNQKENESMLSLLSRLKIRYRLAALSTVPREWLEYKRQKFNLDNYFELIVSSGEYGMEKPDPKIYELVIKKMRLDPSETIFIDDKPSTLPPAEKLGMKTILFRGQKDLEEKLSKFKV